MYAAVLCGSLLLSAPTFAQTAASIAGTVLDAATGAPLAGARISVSGMPTDIETDAEGRFRFPEVPSGTRTVIVTRDGYAPLSRPVDVAAGESVTIEFAMPAQVSVSESLRVVGRLGNYIDTSASAARTSAALQDIPQAIVVLPARLIEDIGALDTKDLYKFMSGVVDSPYSSTVVRGFTQREVLVNGAKGNPYGSLDGDVNNAGFSTSQFRLSNLDRVEVLKGPSSVLYGSGEPGGILNYITKKPKDRREMRAMVGTGQYAQSLVEADVTGPLNAGRTLLGRGAVFFEDRDSFRNNANTRNLHLVGDLTWRPSTRSSLAFEYEYIDQYNLGHRLRGVPVNAAGDFLADYRWTATEPTDFTDLDAHVAQVRLDQQLGGRVRFDSTFRWLSSERHENYHEPRGLQANNTIMQREFRDQLRTNTDWSWNANVNVPVRTGAIAHDVSAGTEVVTQDFLFRFATARQASAGGPVQPIAVGNPVYGTTGGTNYGLTPDRFTTDTAQTTRLGVYGQDLIGFHDKVHLLIGGRVDTFDDDGASAGVTLGASQQAATGRIGVVVKPVPSVSVYGSTATGFVRAPILSQTPTANGPHDPETARQIEVGAKSQWLDGRMQATAAFFSALKQNVLRPDPDFGPTGANTNAVLPVGEIRNRGVEFDLAGQLLPAWNVTFNYAYLDSEILEDAVAALVGRPMPNAAPHALGMFSRLDLQKGAAISGSVQYLARRQEPFAGIAAPAYTVVDAQYVQQVTASVRLLLRCENLFDRRYASSSLFAARAGNIPGQPRTVSVALTWMAR